jgi:hypothetical protein
MHTYTSTYGRNLNVNSKIFWKKNFQLIYLKYCKKDELAIATRYGLDGPRIETRSGRDFSHPSRPALGPMQPPVQWVKRPVFGVDHPPPTSTKIQERVELHVSVLLLCVFMACCSVNFTVKILLLENSF